MGCDKESVSDGAIGVRIGALFALLLVTWITPLIPLKLGTQEGSLTPFLIKAFGAGIVLATGLVHVLPDADAAFTDDCLGAPDFPFAFAIATLSCIITFGMEHSLVTVIHRQSVAQMSVPFLLENAGRSDSTCDPIRHKSQAAASSLVLEAGLIFHSLFIGIDLGVQDNSADAMSLAIALVMHQAFEGLALGSVLVSAKTPFKKHLQFATAFAFTTPIGIAIGIAISSSSSPNSAGSLLCQGLFDAFSAGILLNVALLDLLHPIFEPDSLPLQKNALWIGLLAVASGALVMSAMALWI